MAAPSDEEIDARVRTGRAIRRLGHALVGRQAPTGELDDVATTLDRLADRLEAGVARRRDVDSFGGEPSPQQGDDGVVISYDDRPFSGRASPWGLDLEVHRRGGEIIGLLTLGAAHEGAPDRSHGGIVAGLFDDVFGFVLGILQEPAFTGELTVRYLRPTPLHRPLACRGRLTDRTGRKIWIEGELVDLTTAEEVARGRGLFIAVERAAMVPASAQLPPPPDESGPA
ncbi:MAG: PaaI family thioesterase [Ilumatobacteraceae bacterium]